MTKPRFAAALALLASGALGASEPQTALTLERAQQLAVERNPGLAAAAARTRAAEAELLGARVYPLNPEIGGSRTRRTNDERSVDDHEIGISQGIEIAGQRNKRIAVAEARLDAARALFERARQELVARIETQFAQALAARELARIAELEHQIVASLAAFERRRLDAGASTQIDLNLALAAEGRSERNLELAAAAEAGARARLAETVGVARNAMGEIIGELRRTWPVIPTLDELEREALGTRLDLVAARKEAVAASALVSLERATAAPNLTVGVARGREEETDELTTFSAGFAIPLFDRNQRGIAAARAAQSEQSASISALELEVRREVAEARGLFEATVRGGTALAERVEGTLEENLALLEKALAAGKLRASEVLLFRRELIDSRRELIEALAQAWQAQVALDLAIGHTSVPPLPAASSSTATLSEPPR